MAWGGHGTVATTVAFNYFRYVFEEWAREPHTQPFINATEGGARIAGFVERRLADVLAELPARPRAPLPTGPLLSAGVIQSALVVEQGAAARVLREARSAAQMDTPHAVLRMRAAVKESGLAYAYTWPALSAVLRASQSSMTALCTAVGDATESLLGQLSQALDALARG